MLIATIAWSRNVRAGILAVVCVISIACCFASSFMLFARKTGLAVFVGVVFMILNGLIAFFFGCAAVLQG